MKPKRLATVLENLLRQRWPAFVWGAPGIGKSAIVRRVAEGADMPVIDVRASLLDPTDLRGIPTVGEGRAVWLPPSFLPKESDRPGVLFLDEINAAPPLVQASLYQLVLDRRVGEYVLPPGWWIVAAGNRQHDKAVTFRMSSALANRFVHVTLEPDVDDWREWAIAEALDPLVVSFIGFRPALLWQEPGQEAAYATPRTWQMLSDVLARFGAPDACSDLVPGIVGEGPAREFLAFARSAADMGMIERILADPETAELPQTLDRLFVLTSWFAHSAKRVEVVKAAAALLKRLPPEFAVVLARDMLRAQPSFAREKNYVEFLKKHGKLIAG